MNSRLYTSKQMGDACEMLVAAEMTLAGVPALKMPDNWPDYDVMAQPKGSGPPQRVSVKSRTHKRGSDTFVGYDANDQFDWLAIVLLPGGDQSKRRIFIVPKAVADAEHCGQSQDFQMTCTGDKTRSPRFFRSLKTISAYYLQAYPPL